MLISIVQSGFIVVHVALMGQHPKPLGNQPTQTYWQEISLSGDRNWPPFSDVNKQLKKCTWITIEGSFADLYPHTTFLFHVLGLSTILSQRPPNYGINPLSEHLLILICKPDLKQRNCVLKIQSYRREGKNTPCHIHKKSQLVVYLAFIWEVMGR